MLNKQLLGGFTAITLMTAPLLADPVPAPAATPSPAAAVAKPKLSCRVEEETGSYVRHRICHTREEWAAIDAQNADNTQNTFDKQGHFNAPKQ